VQDRHARLPGIEIQQSTRGTILSPAQHADKNPSVSVRRGVISNPASDISTTRRSKTSA